MLVGTSSCGKDSDTITVSASSGDPSAAAGHQLARAEPADQPEVVGQRVDVSR